MSERLAALLACGLLALLGALSLLRPPRAPAVPPRVPIDAVAPWMSDALPGIGPVRREEAARALRAGRLADLPKPARAAAAEVFVAP